MATYQELRSAFEDPTLNIKVQVACIIAASTISLEATATANHANRLLWAKKVYTDPLGAAKAMVWAVLAANAAATLAAILAATDATVQTAVNANVDVFANGS